MGGIVFWAAVLNGFVDFALWFVRIGGMGNALFHFQRFARGAQSQQFGAFDAKGGFSVNAVFWVRFANAAFRTPDLYLHKLPVLLNLKPCFALRVATRRNNRQLIYNSAAFVYNIHRECDRLLAMDRRIEGLVACAAEGRKRIAL